VIVWVLQTGEPLHVDGGSPRPMRGMNLADSLVCSGHQVVLWSSSFYHQKKMHRKNVSPYSVVHDGLKINLIQSPGYKRNISIMRLVDHAVLSISLFRELSKYDGELPDVVFIGYPPIEMAYVVMRWLVKKKINFIVDVKDQWPEVFVDYFPGFARPLARIFFFPYYFMAKRIFKKSAAICSMSNSYLEWVNNFSQRDSCGYDIVAPLVAPPMDVDKKRIDEAVEWWGARGVSVETRRRLCFVGSLSPAFDFSLIYQLIALFKSRGVECQFVICGDGGSANEIKELMSCFDNVIIPGWIDIPKIKVLYDASAAVMAPYRNVDNFVGNIPNKIIDALANSKPILSSLDGEVGKLIVSNDVGYTYSSLEDLYRAALTLINDQEVNSRMARNANDLYVKKFKFDDVYTRLVRRIEDIAHINK